MFDVEDVRRWVQDADRICVLTGAGVSTDSGIPDFRGPNGVWTKDPKAEASSHIDVYTADPEVRKATWLSRMDNPAYKIEPNDGHKALVELERMGKLHTLVTQNVDGLHQLAGHDPRRVVEMHGTIREVMCLNCDERTPAQQTFDRVAEGDEDPTCLTCGGLLKLATVSFGQMLSVENLRRAEVASVNCDLMLAIGSTLTVIPVALMPAIAIECGGIVAVINDGETSYDEDAHAVLNGSISEILTRLVEP